ncbi:DNA-binding protein [Pedobacter polaris]|uniref:DNA-binding protein n=1 Tax=Pedobacter polaris TaxID=2571273 RepID=A0A4U1CWQ5_9SPHI|nr:S24 family peptidase [Pedobacter polaris]TKC10418.1 DNA-binding protein [Pedobacter polaris]
MTENERLKLIIDKLHFKTQKEFAVKLNIQSGSLSDIIRGKGGMKISNAIKDKLTFMFNVNQEWLTEGIGEPFLKKGPIVSETKEGVPYFDVSLADINHSVFMEEEPEYFVNYKPFNDCTAYLPVYGDSMYPKYASGEIIAVKEVTNFEVLQWGEAYVIMGDDTTNGIRSIKLVHQHADPNKLILRSSNPNFKGDTIINKKSISSMYIIKGKITRNLI